MIFNELSPKTIRNAGVDPARYFEMLAGEFVVYRIVGDSLRRIGSDDYDELQRDIKDGISNLLLSYEELAAGGVK